MILSKENWAGQIAPPNPQQPSVGLLAFGLSAMTPATPMLQFIQFEHQFSSSLNAATLSLAATEQCNVLLVP